LMAFVIDASVVVAWALAEDHPDAISALERTHRDEVRVPVLWWFEVRNALLVNERRKRISRADAALFLRSLSRLALTIGSSPDETEVLAIARRHRLTIYDASYLELALREGVPLATLNAELRQAAQREQVPLLAAGSG